MDEVKEEAIMDEVTEEAIIICLSVRNKCFSEETDTGRELGELKTYFLNTWSKYLVIPKKIRDPNHLHYQSANPPEIRINYVVCWHLNH